MNFLFLHRAKAPVNVLLLIIFFVQQNTPFLYAQETEDVPVVRITEVAWMGSERSTADEWIEIAGLFPEDHDPISLANWTVTIEKSDAEVEIIRFGSGDVVHAGDVLVVSNYDAASSALLEEPFLVTTSVSLPNTQLHLRLRDGSGTLIDEVDDGVGAPFAGINTSDLKATMQRIDPFASGVDSGNWQTATVAVEIDEGSILLGSPGVLEGADGTEDPEDPEEPSDSVPEGTTPDNEDSEETEDLEETDEFHVPSLTHVDALAVSGAVIVRWQAVATTQTQQFRIEILNTEGQIIESEIVRSPDRTGIIYMSNYSDAAQASIKIIDQQNYSITGSTVSVQPLYNGIISEFIPNPKGSDDFEWIELRNPTDQMLNLSGYSLRRGSGEYSMPVGSGSTILPGDVLLLPRLTTGLSLPNGGGDLDLLLDDVLIDRITYESVPEGVSIGRNELHINQSYCVPTDGIVNQVHTPSFSIEGLPFNRRISSPINLSLKAEEGTLKDAICTWDFGDGYTYDGCNPPAHKMRESGNKSISVEVKDYCVNTVIHIETVEVIDKKSGSTTDDEVIPACIPSAFSGITITEFLPRPDVDDATGEWIELHNSTNQEKSLCGWQLDDREDASDPYSLAGTIEAGAHKIFPRTVTGLALNDDQDAVRLIAPMKGGGTGVVLQVNYEKALKGQSYARRDDGIWLWSRQTPESSNTFYVPDHAVFLSPVVIDSALPNPKGPDTWDEYVEIRNTTLRPQWLNSWVLQKRSGEELDLTGTVLAKKETLRINLFRHGFVLANKEDSLSLIDPEGNVRSVLGWKNAKEDRRVGSVKPLIRVDEWKWNADGSLTYWLPHTLWPGHKQMHRTGFASLSGIKNEGINYLKALNKNKKSVLQISSTGSLSVAWVDGVDIQSFLLSSGLAYVPLSADSTLASTYSIYEQLAAKARIGIWQNADADTAIAQTKEYEQIAYIVQQDGLGISLSKDSFVSSNELIQAGSTVDSQLYISRSSGSYIAFDGGFSLHNDTAVRIKAEWVNPLSGQMHEEVIERDFAVLQDRYKPCMQISEIYASPEKGQMEWLELQNVCPERLNLRGWSIDDEEGVGSKPMTIVASLYVEPYGHLVLSGSLLKLALNNSGDEVIIKTPKGTVSSWIRYPRLKRGQSYARLDDSWCITDRTSISNANSCYTTPQKPSTSKVRTTTDAFEIGIKTTYSNIQEAILNTKFDQYNRQLLGLNYELSAKYLHHSFDLGTLLLLIVCIVFLVGFAVYRKLVIVDG